VNKRIRKGKKRKEGRGGGEGEEKTKRTHDSDLYFDSRACKTALAFSFSSSSLRIGLHQMSDIGQNKVESSSSLPFEVNVSATSISSHAIRALSRSRGNSHVLQHPREGSRLTGDSAGSNKDTDRKAGRSNLNSG